MDKNYCVLIDTENASKKIAEIFTEINKYGETPIRIAVGNFFDKSNGWKSICEEYAITPIQTVNFTKGKNSADISLVVEGMDLLYSKQYLDGLIIVASDSDYTALARRWRNEGKEVIGIGKKTTPTSLKSTCTTFINVEILLSDEEAIKEKSNNIENVKKDLKAQVKEMLETHDCIFPISGLVNGLMKLDSSFDVRNYGYKKAPEFFSKEFNEILEVNESKKNIYVAKLKSNKIDKNKLNQEIIEIISHKKNKKINMGELNKILAEKGIDLSQVGYSRIKKYLETINELEIKGADVLIK